jgi:hypothetical protein
VSLRVPTLALTELRAQVEIFFTAHRRIEGAAIPEAELDLGNLSEMLLAALRYVREAYPWLGRQGAVIAAPNESPPGVAFRIESELAREHEAPTVDTCVEALKRALDIEFVDAPCGRANAAPRVYPYHLTAMPEALREADLFERILGVIAKDRWLSNSECRDEVLAAIAPPSQETPSFVELGTGRSHTLAEFLLAGRERRHTHAAYDAPANAFVHLFGDRTRAFGPSPLDGEALEDPFAHASAWSLRDDDGSGSWGDTLVLILTDGTRAAFLDAVWNVSSES